MSDTDRYLAQTDEPAPMPNQSRPIWEIVVEDMRQRDQVGRQRYGTPLQADNGRDALVDAYQELLDLCVYLRQFLAEDWRGRALAAEVEVTRLRAQIAGHVDRIASQSELLSRRAERTGGTLDERG